MFTLLKFMSKCCFDITRGDKYAVFFVSEHIFACLYLKINPPMKNYFLRSLFLFFCILSINSQEFTVGDYDFKILNTDEAKAPIKGYTRNAKDSGITPSFNSEFYTTSFTSANSVVSAQQSGAIKKSPTVSGNLTSFNSTKDLRDDKFIHLELNTNIAGTNYGNFTDGAALSFNVNNPPVFTSSPVTTVNDNSTYTYVISVNDIEGHEVTVTSANLPSWLSLSNEVQVSTLAGSSFGFANGMGADTKFNNPSGVAVDASGNVYVADTFNHRIRKITPEGVVSTLAGSSQGFADGTGATAKFQFPYGLAVDASGNVYVGDTYHHQIRKITPEGVVSTLAGSSQGFANGTGTAAKFQYPNGLAVDASGNVYVADTFNHRIRKITPEGVVSTLAGSSKGFADATGTAAKFYNPFGVSVDASGNVYVADTYNHRIRKITPEGVVSTFAGSSFGFADGQGTAAKFNYPFGVSVDALGNVYVADTKNQKIRKINRKILLSGDATGQVAGDYTITLTANDGNGGTVDQAFTITVVDVTVPVFTSSKTTTFAENGTGIAYTAAATDANTINYSLGTGNDESLFSITAAGAVSFNTPPNFEVPVGSNANNTYLIEVIASDGVNQVSETVTITVTDVNEPPAFTSSPVTTVNDNSTYTYAIAASDINGNQVTVTSANLPSWLSLSNEGQVRTLAGSSKSFADGTGAAAKFNNPSGVAVDASGNVYVADLDNNKIRKITPEGAVSTLAGSIKGYGDGPGADAKFQYPNGIAVDASGNVYVADTFNHRIRKITPEGVVSTLAGSSYGFADGTGAAAKFDNPVGVAVDASGYVYVADMDNNRIRKITPEGVVSTLAGSSLGFANGTGTAAKFFHPRDVAVDNSGNVYVADTYNGRIRKITPEGVVSTLAGSSLGFANGTGAAAKFDGPTGLAVDASGNVYVADYFNDRIRKITPEGVVSTLAGSRQGFADGTGAAAQFNYPRGVAVDASGNVYAADSNNHRIRKISPVFVLNGDATGQVAGDYTITLTANDGNGGTVDQAFTITIVDVTTPLFTSSTTTTFAENGVGIAYTAAATDANPINYSLGTGNDESLFSITAAGAVSFNTPPNFEVPVDSNANNTYLIEVIASDGVNQASETVTITVTDVNEILLVAQRPTANAIGIIKDTNITLTFDFELDQATFTTTNAVVRGQQSGSIAGSWSVSGMTASFNPSEDLVDGEVIHVALNTNIASTNGAVLASKEAFSFTVAEAPLLKTSHWYGVTASEAIDWRSITYGNDRFVAVALDGTNQVMHSVDGETWSSSNAAETNRWQSITYGNGRFLAVSRTGVKRVMYSDNGANWSSVETTELNSWHSVVYGNGRFVAVSYDGTNRVMYSDDNGLSWKASTGVLQNEWRSVTYGNGRFVAVASNGNNRVMYSDDGQIWTATNVEGSNSWFSITYGNGKYVAVSLDGRIMYSSDGMNWAQVASPETNEWRSVTYGNGRFVAVASSGNNKVMYSDDGVSWNLTPATEDNKWLSVTYGKGRFVAVSQDGEQRVMITKNSLQITTSNATKTFDGTPLTTSNYTITAGLLKEGHSITGITMTSTITNAGIIANTASAVVIKDEADNDVTSNYDISYVNGILKVIKADLIITADAKTKFYGEEDPELTYTLSEDLLNEDTLTGGLTRASGEEVNTYAIQSTLSHPDYEITFVTADFTITKKEITVTADSKLVTYGDEQVALTYTLSDDLVGSDKLFGKLSVNTGGTVGTYSITSTLSHPSYITRYVGADYVIQKKKITITADVKNVSYGDNEVDLTYTTSPAIVAGDSFTGALTKEEGDKIGTYDITSTLANANYNITFIGVNKYIIGKKRITIIADNVVKLKSTDDPELTYTLTPGLLGDDVLSGSLSREAGEEIGDYAISSSLANDKYDITFEAGTFSIVPVEYFSAEDGFNYKVISAVAPYTVKVVGCDLIDSEIVIPNTVDYLSKTYTVSAIGGDAFSNKIQINEPLTSITLPNSLKEIEMNAFEGHSLTAINFPESLVSIGNAAFKGNGLTSISLPNGLRSIGDNAFENNEITSLNLPESLEFIGTESFQNNNISTVVFPDKISQISFASFKGNPITSLTLPSELRSIGEYAFSGNELTALTLPKFLDHVGAYAFLGNKLKYLKFHNEHFNVNEYAFKQNANYFEYIIIDTPRLLDFQPLGGVEYSVFGTNKSIRVIVPLAQLEEYKNHPYWKDYQLETLPEITLSDETVTYGTALEFATNNQDQVTSDSHLPGSFVYEIQKGGTGDAKLSGPNKNVFTPTKAGNVIVKAIFTEANGYYTIEQTKTVTIGKKEVKITADTLSKTYREEDPALRYTPEGLIGSDIFEGSLYRAPGEGVGTYKILSNLSNPNYEIQLVESLFTITKRAITIECIADSKIYGENDPVFKYGFISDFHFLEDEKIPTTLTRAPGENVGAYEFSLDINSDNYEVSIINNFDITPKTIMVTADTTTKVYGTADPALTYSLDSALLGNDILTGSLKRIGGELVGAYSIVSSLSNDNYTLILNPVNFVITKKPITVTADLKTKVYGAADPELTSTLSEELIGTDILSGGLTRTAGEDVGVYEIVSDFENTNYALTFVSNTFTITQASQTITFETLSTVNYGDASFRLKATASSGLPISYSSSNTAIATISGNELTIVGGGTVTITASQNGTNNYKSATPVSQDLIVGTLSVSDNTFASSSVLLYPNPSKDVLEIQFEFASAAVKIFDTQGKLIKQINNYSSASPIAIQALKPGVYLVKIVKDNAMVTKRFVKIE